MALKFPELSTAGFGISLEQGAWYVALVFRGVSLGLTIGAIFATIVTIFYLDFSSDAMGSLRRLTLYVLVTLVAVGYIYINTYLWQGITKPDRTGVFPWLIVTLVLDLLFLLIFIISVFMAGFYVLHIIVIILILLIFYCWWIEYSFYKELGRTPVSSPNQLTPT